MDVVPWKKAVLCFSSTEILQRVRWLTRSSPPCAPEIHGAVCSAVSCDVMLTWLGRSAAVYWVKIKFTLIMSVFKDTGLILTAYCESWASGQHEATCFRWVIPVQCIWNGDWPLGRHPDVGISLPLLNHDQRKSSMSIGGTYHVSKFWGIKAAWGGLTSCEPRCFNRVGKLTRLKGRWTGCLCSQSTKPSEIRI